MSPKRTAYIGNVAELKTAAKAPEMICHLSGLFSATILLSNDLLFKIVVVAATT